MTARTALAAVRQRTLGAILACVGRHGVPRIAAELGRDPSCIRRRLANRSLADWSIDELLALQDLEADEATSEISDAARGAVIHITSGDPAAVERELLDEVGDSSALNARIAAALRDRRVSPREAANIAEALEARHRHERVLRRDLLALAKQGGAP